MKLYRYTPIWSRSAKGLILYRCFDVIGEGFTVQSKDFFSPATTEKIAASETQFLELLNEEAPELRSATHPTIQGAIESFDAEFSN